MVLENHRLGERSRAIRCGLELPGDCFETLSVVENASTGPSQRVRGGNRTVLLAYPSREAYS